jgi:hypothetical protein
MNWVTFLTINESYPHMPSVLPIRFAAVLGFALSALASAQISPPTQAKSTTPVQTSPPTPVTAAPAIPPIPLQLPPRHAEVSYASGTLSVSASNSSLNQILREISRVTGIKISGGVTDERVFGQYGPGVPAQILASLLDGTGSNMLLLHTDNSTPGELILTPRLAGPTPPNPNATSQDDEPEYHNPSNVEEPSTPQAAEGNSSPGMPPGPHPPAAGADPSQPGSPNGAKTPEQIYDQLQHMRQQQQPATTPQ